jgi:hypothetical protein
MWDEAVKLTVQTVLLRAVLPRLGSILTVHTSIILIALTHIEFLQQQKWSGEDGPISSCASRQICAALGLSSFTESLVQAFCDTHYDAAQISKNQNH